MRLRAYQIPPTAKANAKASSSQLATGRSRPRARYTPTPSDAATSTAGVVLVPTARPAATIAGASSIGVRPAPVESAATHASQANAGRSVWGSLSW